jgi:hypothetical protein
MADQPDLGWYETSARALWERHRDELMARWLVDHPGRRSRCWWDYEAPRQRFGSWPGWWLDGELAEPRLRLGSIGTPVHEVLAHAPEFDLRAAGALGRGLDDRLLQRPGGRHQRQADRDGVQAGRLQKRTDRSR